MWHMRFAVIQTRSLAYACRTLGPGTWAPRQFPLNDVFLDANGMYAGQIAGEIELEVKVREKERVRPGGGVEDSERKTK